MLELFWKFIWKDLFQVLFCFTPESGHFKDVIASTAKLWPNGTLTIRKAERMHEGTYLCEADNGVGAGLSKVINLHVNGKLECRLCLRKDFPIGFQYKSFSCLFSLLLFCTNLKLLPFILLYIKILVKEWKTDSGNRLLNYQYYND